MRARQLLLVARFAALRMLRNPVSTIVLLLMPLGIIPILGAIFSGISAYGTCLKGAPDLMTVVATGMVVMFQLFGGRYSADGAGDALLSDRRWRIVAAPCPPGIHALGIVIASTLFSLAQGLLLVAFTRVFLGVRWGGVGVVVGVLAGASLLSQLVNLALLLATQNQAAAASLGWAFAWGSAALGGLMFPLPQDRPFWRFMVTWGTPYSLGQTAVIGSATGGDPRRVAIGIGALFAVSALLVPVVMLLGRRRPA